jgi:ribonuclease T2
MSAWFPSGASAQRETQESDRGQQRSTDKPGDFDYYTLVLSWSPTYCADRTSDRYDRQCDRNAPRPYAFVLHGLWPQHKRGYPERCWTKDKPWVPKQVIDQMLDIMPSPALVIHEYKKHGTCSGLDARGYYELSRRLYETIKIPQRYLQPLEPQLVSPEALADEFVEANPSMRHDMLAISCRGAGNRLREIRICFSKTGSLMPCGTNEDQRRLCEAERMYVPPVRASAAGTQSQARNPAEPDSPLPGPR